MCGLDIYLWGLSSEPESSWVVFADRSMETYSTCPQRRLWISVLCLVQISLNRGNTQVAQLTQTQANNADNNRRWCTMSNKAFNTTWREPSKCCLVKYLLQNQKANLSLKLCAYFRSTSNPSFVFNSHVTVSKPKLFPLMKLITFGAKFPTASYQILAHWGCLERLIELLYISNLKEMGK